MGLLQPASEGDPDPPSDVLATRFQNRPTPHFPIIKIHHLGVAPSGSIQESIRYPFICKSSRLASGHSRVFASRINPDESKPAKPRLPIKMSPPFRDETLTRCQISSPASRVFQNNKPGERVEESSDRRKNKCL